MSEGDNLDLQKRSRRRLVGAVALALTAAIVLPMVMDDEPGLPVPEIQVTIPDREADSAFSRPIAGRPAPRGDADVALAPVEQAPGGDGAEDPQTESSASENASAPVVAIAPTPPLTPVPSEVPVPREAPVPSSPQAGAPVAKPPAGAPISEEERVRLILEGRLAAAPATPPAGEPVRAGSYAVQVGAFGEASKAVSLSGDLSKRGFAAYTERAGPVTRVRVGPFPNRIEAERAAEKLRALNMSAVVTAR